MHASGGVVAVDTEATGDVSQQCLLVRLEITPIDNTMVQAFSFLGRFRMAVKNEDDRQDKGAEGKLQGYQTGPKNQEEQLAGLWTDQGCSSVHDYWPAELPAYKPVVGSTDSGWRETGRVTAKYTG